MAKGLLNGFYPGWRVHAGAFLCALITSGCTSYIFGLFVVPVSEELGISRGSMNNGFIAFLLGVALASPFAGRVLDKLPARIVIAAGGFLFGLGMLGLAMTTSQIAMLALIALPIALGSVAAGTLAANTVVVRWFKRRRGTALGILAIATSTGGFIFTPLVALLIETLGWRSALLMVGVIAWVVIPAAALLLIRNQPAGSEHGFDAEMGGERSKGGADAERVAADRGDERLWSYGELLRDRNFWLVSIGITLLFASDQALIVSTVPHLQDMNIDLTAAAMVMSFMSMSAMGGKLMVGYLADKVDLRLVFSAIAVAHIGLLALFITVPSYWVLLVFATVCGIGIGGVFPAWTTLLGWLFGSKSYGTIMGLMSLPMKLSGVVSISFVGRVHDQTGSYATAFMVFGLCIVGAMVMIALVRPPSSTEPPRVTVRGAQHA